MADFELQLALALSVSSAEADSQSEDREQDRLKDMRATKRIRTAKLASAQDREQLTACLEHLKTLDPNGMLFKPVRRKATPDYCLCELSRKVASGVPYPLEDFRMDLSLQLLTAMQENKRDSPVFRTARRLLLEGVRFLNQYLYDENCGPVDPEECWIGVHKVTGNVHYGTTVVWVDVTDKETLEPAQGSEGNKTEPEAVSGAEQAATKRVTAAAEESNATSSPSSPSLIPEAGDVPPPETTLPAEGVSTESSGATETEKGKAVARAAPEPCRAYSDEEVLGFDRLKLGKSIIPVIRCDNSLSKPKPFTRPPFPWTETLALQSSQFLPESELEVFWQGPSCQWGVRYIGKTPLPRGAWTCQYSGEVINRKERTLRLRAGEADYIAELDWWLYVDAKYCGSIARFVNHRCIPNCEMTTVSVDGSVAIGLKTICTVLPGDTLSTDYGWTSLSSTMREIVCGCGALACTGKLINKGRSDKRTARNDLPTLTA